MYSGGVMIYFDRVEVVNVLSASAGSTSTAFTRFYTRLKEHIAVHEETPS